MAERRVPIEPQRVDAPLTRCAVFLVLSVVDTAEAMATARQAVASVPDVSKNVAIRDLDASFVCTVGIGSRIWHDLTGLDAPAELRPFQPLRGPVHKTAETPGDILLHIRADRQDLCFEFEKQILALFGDAVTVEDETVGFRYFDARDLLGFVDGTANPMGSDLTTATLIGDSDPTWAGGSYVVVQKYLHDLTAWQALTTEQQQAVIGRTKADNIEIEDAGPDEQKSHKTLATIEDADGEHDILRDNMPFGSPAADEFGTYFIGYSGHLWVIERMLQRMFIGDPPGLYDRILDFSTPVTGSTFFVPPADVLASLAD